jgi:tetratricopeptide (TPR) repeat protein
MKNTRIAHRLPRVLAAISFGFLLFGPAVARAAECPASSPEDPQERRKFAKEWFGTAEAAENAGNDAEATRAYACSYKMVAHPFTAYNLGRVAERSGDYDLALKMYKAYLTLKPDANDKEDVKNKVTALEEKIAAAKEAATAPATETPTAETTAEKPAEPAEPAQPAQPAQEELAPPPEPKPAPVAETTKPAEPEAQPQNASHIAEWVIGGTSAAALAVGIALNVAARSKMNACNTDAANHAYATANSECNAAPALAYTSYVMFGVAAVGAAVDAFLILRGGGSSSSSNDDSSVGFLWLPSGGGLMARGRF